MNSLAPDAAQAFDPPLQTRATRGARVVARRHDRKPRSPGSATQERVERCRASNCGAQRREPAFPGNSTLASPGCAPRRPAPTRGVGRSSYTPAPNTARGIPAAVPVAAARLRRTDPWPFPILLQRRALWPGSCGCRYPKCVARGRQGLMLFRCRHSGSYVTNQQFGFAQNCSTVRCDVHSPSPAHPRQRLPEAPLRAQREPRLGEDE